MDRVLSCSGISRDRLLNTVGCRPIGTSNHSSVATWNVCFGTEDHFGRENEQV
jgi:nicotinic acid phosphoribosyltransferase